MITRVPPRIHKAARQHSDLLLAPPDHGCTTQALKLTPFWMQ
jgi:hypothetical protein